MALQETEYSKFHVEDAEDEDEEEAEAEEEESRERRLEDETDAGCCGVCCFQGCLWGILGAVYFFIVFPTAIMLFLHGYEKSYPLTLCLGAVLFIFSMCGLPAAFYLVRRHRKRRRRQYEERAKEQAERLTRAAYDNDMTPCIVNEEGNGDDMDRLEVV